MDKMKFEFVHGCFTEKKITSFPSKQCIFLFRERSKQHFAQLFKFDSSSSFRNISINKKKNSHYIKYIVVLGRK